MWLIIANFEAELYKDNQYSCLIPELSKFLYHLAVFFCLLPPVLCAGQAFSSQCAADGLRTAVIESVLDEDKLVSQLTFLTDSICAGRATASPGAAEAAFWISRQYRMMRLEPLGAGYSHSFRTGDRYGHNIVGMVPASVPSDDYIIIMAHYDHLGVLGGRFYPGADSNASGVVAMLSLAHIQASLSALGRASTANIIYVAVDAKQRSMAGSEALYDELAGGLMRNPRSGALITPQKIQLVVNLDIIGSSLAPVTKGREDFLIMLGGDDRLRRSLADANYRAGTFMGLSYDYYGSKGYTDMFLNRVSDQRVFIEHGVNSVMFTSGITMRTNKTDDNVSSLNIPVFRKRILLIQSWLEQVFLP